MANGPKLNKWERVFWACWQEHGLAGSDLVPRFKVRYEIEDEPVAREFDFGSPSRRVLIEIDGLGGYDARARRERCGGHQTAKGMREDSIKRNWAVAAGWRLIVLPSSAVDSPARMATSVDLVKRILCGAR